MIGSLGFWEILLILALAMLLFGPKKLPELGRSLGKGIREFKKGTSGIMDSLNVDLNEPAQKSQAPANNFPAQAPAEKRQEQTEPVQVPKTEPVESTVIDLEKDGK